MMKFLCKSYAFLFLSAFVYGCELQFPSPEATEDEMKSPFLRVHCDVNKTIICTDAVQGKGLEETINGILSEFTVNKWDGVTAQSYYAFSTAQLVRNHPELSQVSDEFKKKRGELLKGFPDFLQKFPQQLIAYQEDKAKMLALLSAEPTVIFPSFYKLVAWLNQHYKNRFAVYLRTFGKDLPEVVPAIEKKAQIKFQGLGEFKGSTLSIPQSLRFANTVALDFFKHSQQSYGIRDDYNRWKAKGFQAEGGKPFPVGLNAQEVEIFFDDNADDALKPIVCPMDSQERMLDTAELLQNGTIVAVNPKEAILDEDYFIKKLVARIAQAKK